MTTKKTPGTPKKRTKVMAADSTDNDNVTVLDPSKNKDKAAIVIENEPSATVQNFTPAKGGKKAGGGKKPQTAAELKQAERERKAKERAREKERKEREQAREKTRKEKERADEKARKEEIKRLAEIEKAEKKAKREAEKLNKGPTKTELAKQQREFNKKQAELTAKQEADDFAAEMEEARKLAAEYDEAERKALKVAQDMVAQPLHALLDYIAEHAEDSWLIEREDGKVVLKAVGVKFMQDHGVPITPDNPFPALAGYALYGADFDYQAKEIRDGEEVLTAVANRAKARKTQYGSLLAYCYEEKRTPSDVLTNSSLNAVLRGKKAKATLMIETQPYAVVAHVQWDKEEKPEPTPVPAPEPSPAPASSSELPDQGNQGGTTDFELPEGSAPTGDMPPTSQEGEAPSTGFELPDTSPGGGSPAPSPAASPSSSDTPTTQVTFDLPQQSVTQVGDGSTTVTVHAGEVLPPVASRQGDMVSVSIVVHAEQPIQLGSLSQGYYGAIIKVGENGVIEAVFNAEQVEIKAA